MTAYCILDLPYPLLDFPQTIVVFCVESLIFVVWLLSFLVEEKRGSHHGRLCFLSFPHFLE